MRLSIIIFGILILTAISTGFYVGINELADENNYNAAIDTKYQTAFGNMTGISEEVNESYSKIQDWAVDKTSFLALIPHAVSLIKNLIALPFQVLGGMIIFIIGPDGLGLPLWTQSFLIAMVLAIIIFAVISIVLRYRDT